MPRGTAGATADVQTVVAVGSAFEIG